MCSAARAPNLPPIPPPTPDFTDEQIALSQTVADQERKRMFAGLASTFANGPAGVLSPGRTSLNPSGSVT